MKLALTKQYSSNAGKGGGVSYQVSTGSKNFTICRQAEEVITELCGLSVGESLEIEAKVLPRMIKCERCNGKGELIRV